MDLVTAILSGFALALVSQGLHRLAGAWTGWIVALLPFSLAIYFARLVPLIVAGDPMRAEYDWAPSLGVQFTFFLDGLGLLFALLITGIGTLIFVYAGGYLRGHAQLGRFYALLLVFMASMLGLVLADNLLLLFVFWELTSISSYFLIGFDHERAAARAGALQALLVTGGGGLALLAGLLLLGQESGSMEISALLEAGAPDLRAHPLYVPAVVLLLVGAFTKSAQFPFHFWLPNAMEAPAPVSAYLHSATMVKVGIYFLARLSPALGGTELWIFTLTVIGAVTMVLGGWIAIVQFDLKRVLAFSTIGALGMCTFLLGIGGEYALPAVLVFLVSHALYKGALFLVTGILDHETGTRDISRLGGLARKMPISAMAALLAGLSMAGIPPLLGFISKEMLYEAALHHACSHALTGIAVAGSAFFVVVAILASVRPFLGEATTTPRPAHEAPLSMWLGPLALAALSLAVGLWPAFGVEPVLSAAGAAVLGRPVAIHLTIWHGWTLPLALSAATVLLGLVILAARRRLVDVASRWPHLAAWGPAHGYELALNGLNRLAAAQTRFLQSGYLRFYLLIVLAVTVALTGWLLVPNARLIDFSYADLRFYHVGLAALILLATLATLLARSRLTAIAALGVVGYCVALVFVVFGAPDIAMTQFLIETLTVIVFVLVFINVPEGSASVGSEVKSVAAGVRAAAGRARDLAVAAAVGGLMTSLVLIAVHVQLYPSISTYYARHSQPEGHGRNVVNVILVDFRGLDTLGEITVLAAAGVGVYALLKLKGPRTEKESPPPRAVETAAEGQDPATGARA